MKKNDVLILTDGRMLKIEEIPTIPLESIVQFVDRQNETFIDLKSLDVEKNLGSSNEVLAIFYSTRSLHLRLNNQ